ncbi:MAG TPA: anaerobic ribonucleoside triphosphate reductase, partial [Clostridiales bacterium]|nr:anaerobic ribonucleoside triphosphate reductase [Clostridiales bacterium]
MIQQIEKRDGRCVFFDVTKIANAIYKAAEASGGHDYQMSMRLALDVADYVDANCPTSTPTVEYVQDAVEKILVESGHARTAKAYILYRNERSRQREMNTRLMKIYEDLTFQSAIENDIKRENANIDGDTAMGTMLKYGSEGAKQFNEMFLLEPHIAKAHREGDIHIHDFDFYTLTTTCTQIDLLKLFDGGFSTGHGFLREPNDIMSYSALACIAIQSNQNDQHGGQSVPNFDYAMAKGVKKSYKKLYKSNLQKCMQLLCGLEDSEEKAEEVMETFLKEYEYVPALSDDDEKIEIQKKVLADYILDKGLIDKTVAFVRDTAEKEVDKQTYQAMEAFIHNLNTMHS